MEGKKANDYSEAASRLQDSEKSFQIVEDCTSWSHFRDRATKNKIVEYCMENEEGFFLLGGYARVGICVVRRKEAYLEEAVRCCQSLSSGW